MAMDGIINEHATGTTFSALREQAGKNTHRHTHYYHTHTHTHTDMVRHMRTNTQADGVCTHTCAWGHAHIEPDYFAYVLS